MLEMRGRQRGPGRADVDGGALPNCRPGWMMRAPEIGESGDEDEQGGRQRCKQKPPAVRRGSGRAADAGGLVDARQHPGA